MSAYDEALARVATEHAAPLGRWLGGRFPAVPADQVEECVQDVLLEACTPERNRWFVDGHQTGGEEELRRRLYTAGWRRVRGELRKVGTQRTSRLATDFDTPDGRVQAGEGAEAAALRSWLGHQLTEAADRFGRARQRTLQRALESLVQAGHEVKPLAERYGLPRRYLAQASVWLKRQLAARSDDA